MPDAKKLPAGPCGRTRPDGQLRARCQAAAAAAPAALAAYCNDNEEKKSWYSEPAKYESSSEGKGLGKNEHGRSCDDSSMGGGGGTQPRAPSATAVVDEELGGSERDGDGGGGGDGLVDGHGGRGTRAGGLRARMLPSTAARASSQSERTKSRHEVPLRPRHPDTKSHFVCKRPA